MELKDIMLRKISQIAPCLTYLQILYDITYMWSLKNRTSEYNKKEADSQIENKLVVNRREKEGERVKIRVGD